jgi:two pore calcium channel protein 3
LIVKSIQLDFTHRFTRSFRVLIFINLNEGKELRRAFRNVRKTLPDIFNVFALFFISLLIFSFIGWSLFRKKFKILFFEIFKFKFLVSINLGI